MTEILKNLLTELYQEQAGSEKGHALLVKIYEELGTKKTEEKKTEEKKGTTKAKTE